MFVRFALYAVLLAVAKLSAWLLAPFLALFVTRKPEPDHYHEPGTPEHAAVHDYLIKLFYWAQTHDAPVDEWFYGGYYKNTWWSKRLTHQQYNRSRIIRWLCRWAWIWRNPAYVVANALGFNHQGKVLTQHRDEGHFWDTGIPNTSFYTATNARGQRAFMYQKQWYYTKTRCVEIYLGWKLFWSKPGQKDMLVIRISPFRQYP